MNSSLRAIFPSSPTVLLRCYKNPRWSLISNSRSVSAGYASNLACIPAATTCSSAVRSVFHAILSRGWARRNCRAFSLAVYATLKASDVSAGLNHPHLRCRRGWGVISASTALMTVVVNRSIIPVISWGWNGWLRVETTLATTRSRHCPSDIKNYRSNCRPLGAFHACRLGAK